HSIPESSCQSSYQRVAASCTPRRIPPHPFHGITPENSLRSSAGNEKVEAVGYEPPLGKVSWASWALFPVRERMSREDYEACSTPRPLIRRVLQTCLTESC